MSRKVCGVCGVVTSRPGGRCGKHASTSRIGSGHVVHTDPRWVSLSKRVIARWVGEHGWTCPGDGAEHPAHPVEPGTLTGDHVLALEDCGAAFDSANVLPLCRSRNSANGARLINARRAGRAVPRIAPALDERAAIRARFLG